MASAVDSEYAAAELYIKQLEEEIGLVFVGLAGCNGGGAGNGNRASNGSSPVNGSPEVKGRTPGRERSTRSASLERSWSPRVSPPRPLSAEQCALLESSRSRSCASEVSVPWDSNRVRPNMSFMRRSRPTGLGRSGSSAPDLPGLSPVGQVCRPCMKRWSDINGNLLNISDLMEHFSLFTSDKSSVSKSTEDTAENTDLTDQPSPANPEKNSREESLTRVSSAPVSDECTKTGEILPDIPQSSASAVIGDGSTVASSSMSGSLPTQRHDSLVVGSNGSGPFHRLEVPMSTSTDGGDLQEDNRSPGAFDDRTEDLHPRFGSVVGNGSMNASLDASTGFLPHDLSTSSQSEEEDGVFHLHRSNPNQDLPCSKSDSCVQDEAERFPPAGASGLLYRMPGVEDGNAPDLVSLENECVDVEVTLPPPKGFETSEDDTTGDYVACQSKHINHSPACSLHNDVAEVASGISGFKPAESLSFPSGLVSPGNDESSVSNGEQLQVNRSLEDFNSSSSLRMHLNSNSSSSIFRPPDFVSQDEVPQVNSRGSSSSAFSPPADAPVNPKPRIPWFSNTIASDRDSYRDSPPRSVADLLSTSSEGSWYSLESPGNETDPGSTVHSLDRKYLMTTTHGAAILNKGNPDAVDAIADGKEALSEDGVITLNLASLEEPCTASAESLAARGEVSHSAPLSQNASEKGEPKGTDILTNQGQAEPTRPLESVSSEASFESCQESLSREISPEPLCCQTGKTEQDEDSSFEEDSVPTYTASLSNSHQKESFEHRHLEQAVCSTFARLLPFEQQDTYPQSKSPIQVHKKSKSFDNSELSSLLERDRRRRRSVNQQLDTTLKRGNQAAEAQKAPEQGSVETARSNTTQARAALFPKQPGSEAAWVKRSLVRSKSDGQNDRKASDVSAEMSQSGVVQSEMSHQEGTYTHTASAGKDASCEESSSSSGQSSAGEGDKRLQLRRRKTSAVDHQALEELRLDVDKQKVVDEQDFLADKSPEMQVVVNSSTPVLSRRRPFRRTLSKDRDAGGSTSSNSTPTPTPTTTPKVSPRSRPEPSKPSKAEPQKESLFMDPAMANTWHGPITSSSKPSRAKPRMGLGMVVSESTPLFGDQPGSSWLTRTGKDGGAHTLPSISRTMLDALHKKFYAFQYQDNYVPPYKVVVPQQISTMPPSPWRRRLLEGSSTLKPEGHGLETVDEGWRSLSCQSSPRLVHRPATPENSPHLYKKLNLGVQERREAEIEAVEACKWLRAAGFPQYAQLYEDGQFPLEVAKAAGDHEFLDRDSMQSLFRRIHTLNKCAVMKIETKPRKVQEESDEEDPCALSDRWEYQKNVRRWSRREADLDNGLMTLKSSSSHDSVLTDQDSSSQGGSPVLDSRLPHDRECPSTSSALTDKSRGDDNSSGFAISPRLRRAASERLKTCKNIIKKMESFTSSRRPQRKFGGAPIVEISGPVVADQENMQAKIQHLNCVDLSPTAEQGPALASPSLGSPREPLSPVSSPDSLGDSASPASLPSPRDLASGSSRRAGSSSREGSVPRGEESGNDSSLSEYHSARSRLMETMNSMREVQSSVRRNNSDTNLMEIFILPEDYKPGSFPKILQNGYIEASQGLGINYRTGSLNLGRGYNPGVRSTPRRGSQELEMASSPSHRLSVYDNVPGLGQASVEREQSVAEELTAVQHDLDIVMNDLFENIKDLNKFAGVEFDEGSSTVVEEDSASDSLPSQDTSREQSQDPALPSTEPQTSGLEARLEEREEGQVTRTLNTSHSSSSAGSLDGEQTEGAAEDSMDTMPRERRDSGVGASLTRGSSGRTRLRWPSFQKCHRPSTGSQALQVSSLTLCQMNVLRKLSLLRLTAIMEKFSPTNRTGWNWLVPRFMKRSKMPDYSDKAVFEVPLQVIQQRTGQPLPQCVLAAMKYLRKAAPDCVGIFRKSGVRSRIQSLRQQLEEHPEQAIKFEDLQAYDVADLLKQFFRELPECLLTNKLSDTFFSIFTNVPENLHMEAVQAAVVLLPDENREVLQSLLCFLYDITETADEHQMTAKNLAVCFAPSLFNMCGGNKPLQGTPSPRRQRKNPSPAASFPDQPSAHLCLAFLISECKKIFMISPHISARLLNSCKDMEPSTISGLFRSPHKSGPDYKTFGEECIQTLLKECHDKNRGWSQGFTERGVEVSFKKPADNYPLREWKCTVEIEAPPVEVLNHIMHERHMWDEDLVSWSLVQKLDKHADVFQYSVNSMAPHPARHYVVLRYWRTDLSKGACAVVAASVDHPEVADTQGVRALLLASYFLVEPCGSGKSRLTHICRDDMRGRSVEWYNKVFGHICAHYLERIRETLKPRTAPDGPETKV